MTPALQREAAWGLCAALGVPASPWTSLPGRFAWDGVALHGYEGPHPVGPRVLFHEIAHWLCADVGVRGRADFGLGPDLPPVATVDEWAVSAVGILLHLRVDEDDATQHAATHGWERHVPGLVDGDRRALRDDLLEALRARAYASVEGWRAAVAVRSSVGSML